MPGKRHSVPEILAILTEKSSRISVSNLCEKYSISEQTYYRWKAKYGDQLLPESGAPSLSGANLQRLRHLEEENRRLKYLLGELVLQQSYDTVGNLS